MLDKCGTHAHAQLKLHYSYTHCMCSTCTRRKCKCKMQVCIKACLGYTNFTAVQSVHALEYKMHTCMCMYRYASCTYAYTCTSRSSCTHTRNFFRM